MNCAGGLGRGGDVFGLKALGALLDLKLHRLPFRQRLVAIHLNRGEMDKNVFSRLALNEPIAFCCVEPLDYTLFSAQRSSLLVLDVRHLPGVTPVGGAGKAGLKRALDATTELRCPQTRRHAGTNGSRMSSAFHVRRGPSIAPASPGRPLSGCRAASAGRRTAAGAWSSPIRRRPRWSAAR